jgi:hypothetical protein
MLYVMIWAWAKLMWLLIFTEISGTYTTECSALTLASIMNYRYSLTTRLQLGTADGCSHPVVKTHTLKTINSNQKLDCQFSVPVHISVSHPILYTYIFTYSWSWALREEPLIGHPLKNFPAFHGTRRFNTVFTRALHWYLS